jgi:hypothetical protein
MGKVLNLVPSEGVLNGSLTTAEGDGRFTVHMKTI